MSRLPRAVLRENLDSHPALVAWRRLQPQQEAVDRIEVLREQRVTCVYRLVGAGAETASVIAKRMAPSGAAPERTMYECVLPLLPVTTPRYFGSLPDNKPDAGTWLFLEDVGGERYSDTCPEHLALAARWVARLHGSAMSIPAARVLPDGGPGRYHAHALAALEKLAQRLFGPDLTPQDVTLLERTVDVLHRLATDWSRIEHLCASYPATVVHGDFRPKNVYLRTGGEGLACYPIDWETAGWGVPAADLTRIDIATYWSIAREWREGLRLEAVHRLASVGEIFRNIAAIDWECAGLAFETRAMISRSLASLAVLTPRLMEAVRMTELAA